MHKTGHLAEEAPVWYEIVRNCLLNDILSFWKERTADYEYGGYITSFDREGNCTGKRKIFGFRPDRYGCLRQYTAG